MVCHLFDKCSSINSMDMGMPSILEGLILAGIIIQILPGNRQASLGKFAYIMHQPCQSHF